MKAVLILLLAVQAAVALDYNERQAARRIAEQAANSPSYSCGEKVMTFYAPGYDPISVKVPDYIESGTRFVIRMPDGESVTGHLR